MASEYGKPAACPTLRPITPQRLGPTRLRPPLSGVWHCRQRLKTSWPPSALAFGSSSRTVAGSKATWVVRGAGGRRLGDRQGPSGLFRLVLLVDDVEQRLAAENHQQGRQRGSCYLVDLEGIHATAFPNGEAGGAPRQPAANIGFRGGLATSLASVLGASPETNCHPGDSHATHARGHTGTHAVDATAQQAACRHSWGAHDRACLAPCHGGRDGPRGGGDGCTGDHGGDHRLRAERR